MDVERLLDPVIVYSDQRLAAINIVFFQDQSLTAHAGKISTDSLSLPADLLAITVAWMNTATSVNINNFQLVHYLPCEHFTGGMAV